MKKSMKILYGAFVLSVVLPVVAYKTKAPVHINENELKIANFKEPSLSEIENKRDLPNIVLTDPFKLNQKQKATTTEKPKETLPSIEISLIYKGKDKFVMIGDRLFKEGDQFDRFIIDSITEDKILLKDKKGEKIWIKF